MRPPSTILRNLSLRLIQPRMPVATVAPLPETTQFNRALTVELDTLQSQGIGVSELGLAQLLDAAINTQKIALDSLVKVSYRDDVDHGAMEEHLERNIDILDACNYFVEIIENMKKYVDSLRVIARLVDSDAMASARALDQLKSCHDIEKKCKAMGKHGLCLMRRMLRQKLSHHHESEFSEIVCGSNAMALMGCRFLELGLSFDDSKHGLPMMKQCQHHTMNELTGQAEGSAEKKKLKRRRSGSLMMNELQQMVITARELKEQMKGKRDKEMIKSSVERLKKSCRELEDGLDFIEGRVKDLYKSLIDVRMVLLGILSHA